MLNDILKILRSIWSHCGLFRYKEWQDKVQSFVLGILLVLLLTNHWHIPWFGLLILILYIHVPMAYGYLLNSLTDKKKDEEVGKDRIKGHPQKVVVYMVMGAGLFTLLIPTIYDSTGIMLITIFGFLFTTAYSLKPFILKERGSWGLFTAAVTQRMPFLFLVFILPSTKLAVFYFFGWLILLEFLTETAHQLEDYPNDKKTDTKTFVVYSGLAAGQRFVRLFSKILIGYVLVPAIVLPGRGFLISLVMWIFSYFTFQFSHHALNQSHSYE